VDEGGSSGDPLLATEAAEDGTAAPPIRRPYPDEAEG
jgi:hypothetical protein